MTKPDITREQAHAVLDVPLPQPNDAEAATVRDYLVKLLADLWEYGEGFDSKRPFGNSGWEHDLYGALARAGMVSAVFDSNGYIDDFGDDQQQLAHQLVAAAIRELGTSTQDGEH